MQQPDQSPTSHRRVPSALPLLLSAVIGGVVAAGAITLLDDDGGATTRTVVQQAPVAASNRVNAEDGLTPSDIYERYAPGVVFIKAERVEQVQSPFDLYPSQQRSTSTGTGFVINRRGEILTNAHVVEGTKTVAVQFADKHTVKAKVVGQDTSTDLALLRVDPEGLDLRPLPLGSSRDVQVGDPTIAIGNPFGLDRTLTTGVVSALQRRITAPDGFAISDVIQTDAAINPGNSGGPLIDAAGRVIGINSQIETGGGSNGNVGIGFAVPIDTAKRIIPDLEKSGKVERGYLGVGGLTIDGSLAALDLPVDSGVLVQSVTPGSPADEAGLQAGTIQAQLDGEQIVLGGDIVTEVDGKAVKRQEDLARVVGEKRVGQTVKLTVVRGGDERELTVKLAQRPATVQGG
ncbi:S1C family serine protease [Conexibacter sp. SYSU D00693]|uniref:S1C family serine protease n=1 Tax=Conexibacter sp. SYSU D00693 TaxID=2812560 RepID=UPI00196AB8C6|nr:trypsin-like peptidase domain-containing protein [Conexibacter sp. SYSU D00693]